MSEGHRNQLKKHPSRQTQNQLNKKLKKELLQSNSGKKLITT